MDRDLLRRRALRLEWGTIAWNCGEVVVTVTLGIVDGSLALVAFGLDSLVEIFASLVVVQHLRDERVDPGDRRIHRALRAIAVAFFVLAAYLTVAGVRSLVIGNEAGESPWGVAYLAVTAVAMIGLALAKRRVAAELESEPLEAEAAMTLLDGGLCIAILTALLLNIAFGWWWADPLAALVIAGFATADGIESWRNGAPHLEPDEPAAVSPP